MFHSHKCTALAAVAALLVSALPLVANAGEVDNRINRQQSRIDQGVTSGQLTRHEYNSVESRLDKINASRVHDLRMNDGHLTTGERENLNKRENRLSNTIYFDKHNSERQPGS